MPVCKKAPRTKYITLQIPWWWKLLIEEVLHEVVYPTISMHLVQDFWTLNSFGQKQSHLSSNFDWAAFRSSSLGSLWFSKSWENATAEKVAKHVVSMHLKKKGKHLISAERNAPGISTRALNIYFALLSEDYSNAGSWITLIGHIDSHISHDLGDGVVKKMLRKQKAKEKIAYTPKTKCSPLKIGHPKRKLSVPTIHFQVLLLLVSGRMEWNGIMSSSHFPSRTACTSGRDEPLCDTKLVHVGLPSFSPMTISMQQNVYVGLPSIKPCQPASFRLPDSLFSDRKQKPMISK